MVNKSILTPQNKEKSLEFFFPSQKEINEGYVKNLIEEERILLQNGTLPYPGIIPNEMLFNIAKRSFHLAFSSWPVEPPGL